MTLPRRPRAVLFDVYGTLLADVPALRAFSRARIGAVIRRHRLGITPASLAASLGREIAAEHEALHARGVEHPEVRIERIWGKLFPRKGEEELRHVAVSYERAVFPVKAMPGCRRLLAFLRRAGAALGIVSNAQFYTPLILEARLGAGLEELGFEPSLCVFSFEHGAAKPQRLLFDLAAEGLEAMGIGRMETLMVGNDPVNDVEPAALCGFMTVLLTRSRRERHEQASGIARIRPDDAVASLDDLRRLLGGSPRRVPPNSMNEVSNTGA